MMRSTYIARRTFSNTSSHTQQPRHQPHRHRTPTPKKPRIDEASFRRAAKEVLAEQERLFQALPCVDLVVYERRSGHDSKSKIDDYDDDD
ncbi:hypothetical protein CDV31_002201 [Fusarium ambrosium]|uniref:Uncharacterized protein n=1 Tax=Fusarium ambrosium TaxID=131363 RepID=A0A428UX49_9HYPO|nr:hypothetical protein CDV31_002201 [Fusarium ambrosium]